MATLKITSNIPDLEVIIFDDRLQLLPDEYKCSKSEEENLDSKDIEESVEIKLKPGLYKVMLGLPYCYPTTLKTHERGVKMSRRTKMMSRLIDLPADDSIVKLKFNATFSEEKE